MDFLVTSDNHFGCIIIARHNYLKFTLNYSPKSSVIGVSSSRSFGEGVFTRKSSTQRSAESIEEAKNNVKITGLDNVFHMLFFFISYLP